MNTTKYFYNQYHLKERFKKAILSIRNELKPFTNSMIKAKDDNELKKSIQHAIHICGSSNSCVNNLIEFYEAKDVWVPYVIDSTKDTFGLHDSSYSGTNRRSVKNG